MIVVDVWFIMTWFIASALMYRSLKKRIHDEDSFLMVAAMSFFWPVTLIVGAWRKIAGT